ncbi:hypothetical protein PMAYCL1PPCAC_05277, partial [Pristionchus mayeri]
VYNASARGYCELRRYKGCDSNMMVETDCTLTCPYSRAGVTFRNSTSMYFESSSLTCKNGQITTKEGKSVINLRTMRPTCGFKAQCNICPFTYEKTCPQGYSCDVS